MLVGCLCLASHRQRGHLETAPPFTVPCEGRQGKSYCFGEKFYVTRKFSSGNT